MIKLTKCSEPEYLSSRSSQWSSALNEAIFLHGNYDSIPENEKESLISHYRHQKIKDALFITSHHKCAFCECIPEYGGNFIQIEHFYPKSIYPELCFSWDNFLPSCNKCNLSKSNLDTNLTPIINPYDDEPSDHLYISLLKFKPLNDSVLGCNTVQELKLNSSRHINTRGRLLGEIENITEKIREKIEELNNATTKRVTDNRRVELMDLVEELDFLMSPAHIYSFFCKQIIMLEPEYALAKSLI
ncbi:HNH endonuclease family protein [Pectobacterium brasiliense]|uniref:hypothetical protein n=1 Tax=Pectobacterium brasiliense TaxID=180957 RepID=UPI001969895B|nr:hypothetical protein [Pectobacterium brasiliense]MBN3054485.1 HNH endonuclease [Pectobacterium brasiliense]